MDLKTLMGYVLKYNLNVKLLTTTDNNAIYRAIGVNVHTNEIYLYCDTTSCGFAESLSNITIVLRPLSDITKEIEHNGEKFVPIIEIAKLYASTDNIEAIKGAVTNFHYFKCYYGKSDYQILIVNDNLRGWFSYYFNDDEPNCGINIVNEWEVRDKLFEWHFDVFGLIKVGLAIDINTLSE